MSRKNILKILLSLLGLFIVAVAIHEGTHYILARIMNIPVSSFELFDFRYLAPRLQYGSTENNQGLTIALYAGGLFTGILLLAILIFKREWFKQSWYRWWVGALMALFGSLQLGQGLLEGAFHDIYITGSSNASSISNIVQYIAALAGFFVYWLCMPNPRKLPN